MTRRRASARSSASAAPSGRTRRAFATRAHRAPARIDRGGTLRPGRLPAWPRADRGRLGLFRTEGGTGADGRVRPANAEETFGDRERAGVRPGEAQSRVRRLRRRRVKEWYGGRHVTTHKNERNAHFAKAVQRLKDERRYRVFIDLERDASRFPTALWRPGGGREAARSDDLVLERLPRHGRPSGRARRGDRFGEPARSRRGRHAQHLRHPSSHHRTRGRGRRPSRQGGRARFHLGLDLEPRGHLDHRLADAELPDPVGRAQPQLDDRGRPPVRMREAGLAAQ